MYVFAYGSLAAEAAGAPQVATIGGLVRSWDVAMDNVAQIPGYKYYVDPVTGERPAAAVTFLNLAAQADVDCLGFLLPADPRILAMLDRRERNYDRVEVTDRITAERGIRTRVYTYLGKPEARERYATAALEGRAVIAAAYRQRTEHSFREAGLWEQYTATTRPPECPVRDLTRIDLSAR